jgi:hypothetical protein
MNVMKIPRLLLLLVAAAAVSVFLLMPNSPRAKTTNAVPQTTGPQSKQAVIVELFTSEGCSSCPPADALLKELSEAQPIAEAEIIALEEHVDYWNSLGWTDPFSSREISERQEKYAGVLRYGGIYTPQMVVDGHAEFPGGREKQARQTIEQASQLPKADVKLLIGASAGPEKFTVRIDIQHLASIPNENNAELWVAVTEKGLHSQVTAGENSGELLQHAAIVRSIHKVETIREADTYAKEVTLSLGKNWKRENLAVAAFVVQEKSRRIVGAASLAVQ